MDQTLEKLIKLQEIDQRLLEIKNYMGDLPKKVQTQENDLTTLNSEIQLKKEQITALDKNIRSCELNIEDMSTKMKKYKEQIYLVKSNKEYESLNHEIDHIKTLISESESQLLDHTVKKEDLEEYIKINLQNVDSINKSLSTNKLELQSALEKTQNEQKELELNRDSLFKNIEPSKLNNYERIRQGRDVGMISIIGQACGDCYSQLPPQIVIEIKKNSEIISCPSCSVMLFWDGAEE